MCRSRREIREKIAELERSGELPGLIEKAVAEAVDEPEDYNRYAGGNSYIVAELQRLL
jgi:hypothetical protein